MSHAPEYSRDYYRANKKRIAARKAERQKNDLNYRLKSILRTIIQRCEDPRHVSYQWYGAKNITTDLTLDQLKIMWDRDGTAKMRKPSIDRDSASDNYTFSKCCFRELRVNQQRGWIDKQTRSQSISDGMNFRRIAEARKLHAKVAPFHPRYKVPKGKI